MTEEEKKLVLSWFRENYLGYRTYTYFDMADDCRRDLNLGQHWREIWRMAFLFFKRYQVLK
jgi:hypothetical protein